MLSLVKLFQMPWFDRCLINFNSNFELTSQQQLIYNCSINLLTEEEQNILVKLEQLSPIFSDLAESRENLDLISIGNRGFTDCYINMFTEADYNTPVISEKSIKPFVTGQLWAIFGNSVLPKHLEDLGFDLFQDYITTNSGIETMHGMDKLRYDLDYTLLQITNLLPNIESVWNDTYLRRQENFRLVHSTEFLQMLRSNLNLFFKG